MALLASSGSLEREGESVRKQSYAVKTNKVPEVIKYAFSDLAHVHRLSKDLECLIRTLQVCHVLPSWSAGIDNLCKQPDNRPLALIVIHKVDDVPTLLRFKFGAIPNTFYTGVAICITFGLT